MDMMLPFAEPVLLNTPTNDEFWEWLRLFLQAIEREKTGANPLLDFRATRQKHPALAFVIP